MREHFSNQDDKFHYEGINEYGKKYGRVPLASYPFRFLRPFNGCVPQPEKKRRLFDSHNPNSLMVAELGRTISKYLFERNTPFPEKQKNVSS